MALEVNPTQNTSLSSPQDAARDSSKISPEITPASTLENSPSLPTSPSIQDSSNQSSQQIVQQPVEVLQQLRVPVKVSRKGQILLTNVEKFLSKFKTYRVSAFIENANHQLEVRNFRWFRNMFLSNEFFKGTQCADAASRQKLFDEVFDKVATLVRSARGAEASWYRGVLEKAALKREVKTKGEAKHKSHSSNREKKDSRIADSVTANSFVSDTTHTLDQKSQDSIESLDELAPFDRSKVHDSEGGATVDESYTEEEVVPSEESPNSPAQPTSAEPSPPTPPPPVHPARHQSAKAPFDPRKLRDSVLTIPLSVRTQNLLFPHSEAGTIADLLKSSANVFSKLPGIGDKTVLELRDGLVKLNPPLGLLFDPITVLPVSEAALDVMVRLIGEPAPRCFKLLFLDFKGLGAAGVSQRDLLAIEEAFKSNGFTFKSR